MPLRAGVIGARNPLLDRRLGLIRELEAICPEELDAVVLIGVVRGGDHHCELQTVAAHQQRRSGRRKHAAEQHIAAGGGHSGCDRVLQHLPGLARVADDQHLRMALIAELDGRA